MDKFIELFAEAMEMKITDVKPSDKFRDYEEWDSLAALSMLAMINENYEVTIPRRDFEEVQTVSGLYDLIMEMKREK